MEWYPLELTCHVRAYSFGGRLIPEVLGKRGVPEGVVAETWEVSDYREARATVAGGPLAGRPFNEVVLEHPEEVVGLGFEGDEFPLLGKFLDASRMLPVHLHPDDETARRLHGEPHGKTEAWHVLWAAEGASILAGVREGLSREELFRAFRERDYDRVMPRHGVRAGDTVYVPGGIIHTFGPDTLIFEIQQTSDLGQFVMPEDLYGNRLSDEEWERNINATLDELKTDYLPRPNPGLPFGDGPNRRVLCAAGPHFALERWTLDEPGTLPVDPGRCLTLHNVGAPLALEYPGGRDVVRRGASRVLPAAIGEVRAVPEGEGGSIIVCYVPDLERDVIRPLRDAGHSDESIRSLGEVRV